MNKLSATNKPTIFQAPIGIQWNVIVPPVYRYMDKEYVDAFFSEGKLRVSSFAKFHKHSDEQRTDKQEGKAVLEGVAGDYMWFMGSERGTDTFVLSTSLLCSSQLMDDFSCDGLFEIHDSVGFAHAIATEISGMKGGMQGNCTYANSRVIISHFDSLDPELIRSEDGNIDLLKLKEMQNIIGGHKEFFLKEKSYMNQAEYRFVWAVNKKVPEYIDIEVPAALKFCRKVEEREII